jgi:hypothetical protein
MLRQSTTDITIAGVAWGRNTHSSFGATDIGISKGLQFGFVVSRPVYAVLTGIATSDARRNSCENSDRD